MAQNSINFFFKTLQNLRNRSFFDVRPIIRSGMSQTFQRTFICHHTRTHACVICENAYPPYLPVLEEHSLNLILCAYCPHTNVPDVRMPKNNFKTWRSYSLPSFWWVRRVHSSFLSKYVNIWNLNIFAVFCRSENYQNPVARAKNDLKTGFRRSKWVQNWKNM